MDSSIMNICIITHVVVKGDGQGRVNYEVVNEALNKGHEITLIASRIDENLSSHPKVKWIKIDVSRIPTVLLKNLIFSVMSSRWLQKHRSKFDIIQTNGAITSAATDVNAVHFVHSAWLKSPAHISKGRRDIYGLYQWLYSKMNAHWEKDSFKSSSVLIAVSGQVKRELIEIGVPEDKIRIVINGVDLSEFYPGEQDRAEIGLPNSVPLAFFAGDIRSKRKNLDTVLKALVNVPALHLAVAGKTEGSPYPQMSEELGVSDRVHFLGFRRDMADLMRAVDFFVFPSRYEACTLVLIEAMASALPVVTAAATGGSELVTSQSGFILKDSENIQELAIFLKEMIADPSKIKAMSHSALNTAKKYAWSRQAAQYLNLFEEIEIKNQNRK
jgi:glycosyltransferase involved in cell wall biosynthesis